MTPLKVLILLLVLLPGLSACSQAFHSPVDPFQTPPATTGELARHLEGLHGEADNLFARASVTVSRKHRPGQYRALFYSIYLAPDNAMLKVDDPRVGEFFRVVQRGQRAAVSLSQEGRFYVGEIAELEKSPEALFGLQPIDVVKAIRVGAALAEGLRTLPSPLQLGTGRGKTWRIGLADEPGRMDVYSVRRSDGLVSRFEVADDASNALIRIDYQAYQLTNETVFPSLFTIYVPEHQLVIEVEIERITEGRVQDTSFSLSPPEGSGLIARPLQEWLAQEATAGGFQDIR